MTSGQPNETPREQIAREAVETYAELTARAETLPPEVAELAYKVRDLLTDVAAVGAGGDLRIAAVEQEQEEFKALFFGDDLFLIAAVLRKNLTPAQRIELAEMITAP